MEILRHENISIFHRTFLSSVIGKRTTVALSLPAKLNLFLYINGKRPDGYHELQTLFQFLDFGDWLSIQVRNDGKINLVSSIPDLNVEDNLIYRAAALLQRHTNTSLGADLELDKILPIGGGVGGGSSNAATTLVALNDLWKTGLTTEELANWA